ncbi:MAG: asparagine synthase (glutamine-hydrolyzing) [Verrucomicrobiia bacterium]|jgi:asparagine synthase (glutamine-hydrolysing)
MCGIAGVCGQAGRSTSEIEAAMRRMIAGIKHRGPDDDGFKILSTRRTDDGITAIANTRLAILDLSPAGHQPMFDSGTGNWIVFNGEIYNHLEIRAEIGGRVGQWHSTSDTETILQAYRLWGRDCVQRLRGMFAFAIWDAAGGELWCARDRLGIKPFYYCAQPDALLFASEVRSMLASGWLRAELDHIGLAGYVRFGAVPEPYTLLKGVQSLPAGHWMTVHAGRIEKIEVYWRPEPRHTPVGRESAVGETRRELERAVHEHLISDVPVACFLSGGIDSSVITGLAAKELGNRLQTFTLGFHETASDESAYAEAVARKYGTTHHLVRLSYDEVAAQVPVAVRVMDLPTMDGANTFIISKAVADRGFKVVLSGLGGDELFGGYPTFLRAAWAECWAPWLGLLPSSVRALAVGGGNKGRRAAELLDRYAPLSARYASLRALWSQDDLERMGLADAPDWGDAVNGDAPLASRVSVLELSGYMRSVLLRDSDVLSMAHGLELRVPFLDHELVETCLKYDLADQDGSALNKAWLLKTAGDLLPRGIADRPKQGFILPMAEWMRGPLKGFVGEGLAVIEGLEALPKINTVRLLDDFGRGRLHWSRVWQFVVLGHWLDENFLRQPLLPDSRERATTT